MNNKIFISGGIGLILVIAMIALVILLQPARHFDGWWILLPIVLVVAFGSMFVMNSRGGAGRK